VVAYIVMKCVSGFHDDDTSHSLLDFDAMSEF
jgi:hypothetical protein